MHGLDQRFSDDVPSFIHYIPEIKHQLNHLKFKMHSFIRHSVSILVPVLSFVLFLANNNHNKEYWGIGCDAQRLPQQSQRFLINLGADLAEVLSHYPQSSLARVFNPIIKRAQNQFITNNGIGFFGETRGPLLSNDPNRVQFLVHNDRSNPNSFFYVDPRDPTFRTFRVGRNSQVKILIHGFNSDRSKRFPLQSKNAYLSTTDHTVIIVDWSLLAQPKKSNITGSALIPLLPAVADNGFRVGSRVADLIIFLLQNGIISSLEQVHIVGHSLGAHVGGYAGLLVQQRLRASIGRITGLDPAGPLFRSIPENLKLDSSDAKFVDVIHTSISGLYRVVGHADFYPNGGVIQPHCLRLSDKLKVFECNHLSAYDYFTRTILERNIRACGCKTWQEYRLFCKYSCSESSIMGEYASTRARGKYFLDLFM